MAFVAIVTGSCYLIPGTPEAAFHEFQTYEHKEAFLVAPLCVAGERVVPLVSEKVRDKSLDGRLYAIAFLGTSNGDLPVSVLESIVRDESENVTIRDAALTSLYALDEQRGKSAADILTARQDFLGVNARKLIRNTEHTKFRLDYQRETCSLTD